MKRGQITIFVIIGILLISSVLLFFVFKDSVSVFDNLSPTIQDASISYTVSSCIEDAVNLGLEWSLFEFGFYRPGDGFSPAFVEVIANDTGNGTMLADREVTRFKEFNKRNIRRSMGYFFEDFFPPCINGFEHLIKSGKDISFRPAEYNFTVTDDFIILDIDFPITETIGESANRYDKLSHKLDVDLGKIISTTNLFIDETIELNDLPEDLINEWETSKPDLDIVVHYLYYGWPDTPYIQWVLGFENSRHRVSFIINYDWDTPDVERKSVDEIFDELEADAEEEFG